MLKTVLRACALIAAIAPLRAIAPAGCDGTPAYSPCDLYFDLSSADAKAHPDPWATANIQVEFRAPDYHTWSMPGFWDGQRMVVRFAPTEPGKWTWMTTSNLSDYDGKSGTFNCVESQSQGFIIAANMHHWATLDEQVVIDPKKPHLWIGDVADRLAFLSDDEFEKKLRTTIQNKFTHLRVVVLGSSSDAERVMPQGHPDPSFFDLLDRRLLEINKHGISPDLVLADNPDAISHVLPTWQVRKRFVRYLTARYAALNMTWQGVLEFEDYKGGRALLKELGEDIKGEDPYQHPRSTNAKITSSPLMADGWMTFIIGRNTQPGDEQIASVEHQLYPVPYVAITTAARLWSTTSSGAYPVFEGGNEFEAKHWFDLISDTRHWEMEPYFDVDGGSAIALDGTEYILYVEKPGPPVEVLTDSHKYDVWWFNPLTGDAIPVKDYRGRHYTGTPPDTLHPWVLDIARESHKASMLHSYRFESVDVQLQEMEQDLQKIPYQITAPAQETLSMSVPAPYEVKLKRMTRGTRTMMYLWTGEIAGGAEGFRVLGTGESGTLHIPQLFLGSPGAVLDVRVQAINANGKAYQLDKLYQMAQ
jgi:hypothetical protein